jgi:hypothetical protein
LCQLWNDIQEAKKENLMTTISNPTPVTCQYVDNPTSAEPLCSLWCQLQQYQGKECQEVTTTTTTPCPALFASSIEVDLLCVLWSTLAQLESTLGAAPHNGLGFLPVPCKYVNYPMDASLLCDLWCKIQLYENKTCIEEEATTVANCPAEYLGDPEESQLCQLWNKLTDLEEEAMSGEGMPSELEPPTTPTLVICIHKDNPTSADKLCDLWCQIALFEGSECSPEVPCPPRYSGDPEEETLCQLWKDLQNLEAMEGMPSHTLVPAQSVDCVYSGNPTSEEDLCDLYCQIQTYEGKECAPKTTTTTPESCPTPYVGDTEETLLCMLWEELMELTETFVESGMEIPTTGFSSVLCLYEDNPTSSVILCQLWCRIQLLKGAECGDPTTTIMSTTTAEPCPGLYQEEAQAGLLCSLWSQLQVLREEHENIEGMPGEINPDSSTLEPVQCFYESYPSSVLLCDLWCQIQTFMGSDCAPETTTIVTTTAPPCPDIYEEDSEKELLCSLWNMLESLKVENGGSPTFPPDTENLTPVQCLYKDYATSSEALCNLWCEIQIFGGNICFLDIPTTTAGKS